MKYHIKLDKKMIKDCQTVVLPGDPGRVAKTALFYDAKAQFLASNREYTSYLANINNQNVLVCSTGIGGPSVAIAIEELAGLGIQNFIRIGTTGAIQEHIEVPSLIVSTGSVRLDGASTHYAPIEYPALGDHYLVHKLLKACQQTDIPYYYGITASSDTFYPGQERYNSYSGYVIKRFQNTLKEWQALNVLNYEMETSTLFTVCSALKLKAAAICSVIANRTKTELPDDKILKKAEENLFKVTKIMLEN